MVFILLPPTCVKPYNFIFNWNFCSESFSGSIRPLGRHVLFFTSNCMFEARGCTIIAIQGSQGDISDFTSNFWNPPLDTLNYNNKFGTFSSCCTGQKVFMKRQLNIPHKYLTLISGIPTEIIVNWKFLVPHYLVHDSKVPLYYNISPRCCEIWKVNAATFFILTVLHPDTYYQFCSWISYFNTLGFKWANLHPVTT